MNEYLKRLREKELANKKPAEPKEPKNDNG